MVKIRSPIRVKDLEVKAGTMFILDLEKGESIAFLDKDDNVWELSRNARGRHNLRRLKNSPTPTIGEIP